MTAWLTLARRTIRGDSPALNHLLLIAGQIARDEQPVLLVGESGTGKDLLASALHAARPQGGKLAILNAGAVPEDILDRELYGESGGGAKASYPAVPRFLHAAQGGTLYLDDICRIPDPLQARLIELCRTRTIVGPEGMAQPFTARMISATNLDPLPAIAQGLLRRELYDRLSANVLHLPPLRERRGDAALIAAEVYGALLRKFRCPAHALAPHSLARLDLLPWPGNVRQLLNTLRRMALSPEAAEGQPPELPADLLDEAGALPPPARAEILRFSDIERRAILDAIARNGGSVQHAADDLGLAASTIYRKLKVWQAAPI